MTAAPSHSAHPAGVSIYLGLGATPASEGRGQGAGPTAALMAQLLTQMDGV